MYSLCTMLERSISRDDAIFSRYFQTKVNYKDKRAPGHQFDDSVRLIGQKHIFLANQRGGPHVDLRG